MLLHDKTELNIVPAPVLEDWHETGGMQAGFQIPGWIWAAMLGAYAVFFAAITAATGRSGSAIFAIVISIGYVVIFFALVAAINNVKGPEQQSPLARHDGVLETWTGPIDVKTAAGQVLVVPLCLALFAIGILIVRMIVVP